MARRIENAYGLTYAEWCAAAGYSKPSIAHYNAWKAGEDPSDHRATRGARNRSAPSAAAKRRTHERSQVRGMFTVYVDEREPDAASHGVSQAEVDRFTAGGGSEWSVHVQQPGAARFAERLQFTQGSSWENDGPDFAYNRFEVNNDKERRAAIKEIKDAGGQIVFTDTVMSPVRGLRRQKKMLRAVTRQRLTSARKVRTALHRY